MCEKKQQNTSQWKTMSFEALTVSRFIKLLCLLGRWLQTHPRQIVMYMQMPQLDTYYRAIACHNMQIIFVDFRFYKLLKIFKSFLLMLCHRRRCCFVSYSLWMPFHAFSVNCCKAVGCIYL